MSAVDFSLSLFKEIVDNLNNNYIDNLNTYTSVHHEEPYSLKTKFKNTLKRAGIIKHLQEKKFSELIKKIEPYFADMSNFYEILEDKASQDLLVKIITYRILGRKKYKLPLNSHTYWEKIRLLEEASKGKNYINIDFLEWKLSEFEIINNSQKIKLYYVPMGILDTFILKQYECSAQNKIKAQEGNIVIDAGGCWGDTALYFASEVGETGKVYTFEFIPSNLSIMKNNFEMNPTLRKQIEIIERPLWQESDKVMYYADNGPASFVSFAEMQNNTKKVLTLSIDDFVKNHNLQRIDFIKMDIEGAELNALKGATNVIKNFRPNLAISIYHSLDDFVKIPEFIRALNLGYKFYLGHFTIHSEETVLYAMPESNASS